MNRKEKKKSKFREKLDMYDMILANIIAGKSIIEPSMKLDASQLAIGFSNISSDEQLTKYYMINKFPDYLPPRIMDLIRQNCMQDGVKINFYFHTTPHNIDWDSTEMKNRMTVWKRYSEGINSNLNDAFTYRSSRGEALAKRRMIASTRYLNEADLEYKRTTMKVYIIIEVSARRTEDSLANMAIHFLHVMNLAL